MDNDELGSDNNLAGVSGLLNADTSFSSAIFLHAEKSGNDNIRRHIISHAIQYGYADRLFLSSDFFVATLVAIERNDISFINDLPSGIPSLGKALSRQHRVFSDDLLNFSDVSKNIFWGVPLFSRACIAGKLSVARAMAEKYPDCTKSVSNSPDGKLFGTINWCIETSSNPKELHTVAKMVMECGFDLSTAFSPIEQILKRDIRFSYKGQREKPMSDEEVSKFGEILVALYDAGVTPDGLFSSTVFGEKEQPVHAGMFAQFINEVSTTGKPDKLTEEIVRISVQKFDLPVPSIKKPSVKQIEALSTLEKRILQWRHIEQKTLSAHRKHGETL